MSFPNHIFKAYDIRGLWQTEISPELAYKIGRSFVGFLRSQKMDLTANKIVVGRDMRASSVGFQAEVIRGVRDEGVEAVDIGLVSTPLFNFACANYSEHAGGIMVTASHNPAEYNGFKMTLGNGLPVGGNTGMPFIRDCVRDAEFTSSGQTGGISQRDILPDYMAKILSLVNPQNIKPLKVVIDAGNGMAAATFPELTRRLALPVEYLYLEPDGNFPNHEANPLQVSTLVDLQKKVVAVGADFGFALDGDADRIGLVDETGRVVDASFVGALLGLEVLRQNPGSKMYYDLRSSQIVPEVWQAAGGSAQMCAVGHANIKKLLKEQGGVFASELSLHLYYHDMYDVESSDLSFLYVLQMLSRPGAKLSALVRPLQKYAHSGEINFAVDKASEIMDIIEKKYAPTALEISRLDGLWLRLPWGWVSVRASNTEPLLRLNLETATADLTVEKVAEISATIARK